MGGLLVLSPIATLLGGRTHHESASLDLDHPHAIHDLTVYINDGSKGRRHASGIVRDIDGRSAFGLAGYGQAITFHVNIHVTISTSDGI